MPSMQSTLKLNDGHEMPLLGFGTGQLNELTNDALGEAIAAGYRLIDTATRYNNETRVGAAVRASGVPRASLFITTKIWPDRFDSVREAFSENLGRLQMDYVDLYMLHWPAPWQNNYVDAWRQLIRLREEGRSRSIGVANFDAEQIQRLADETGVVPAVNQVEMHPHFQQTALRAFHAAHGIVTEAWSPLGAGRILDDPSLTAIARRHGKTTAQVILRWLYDSGVVAIPKSATPQRIRANLDLFDFDLTPADIGSIAALDSPDGRIGASPEAFPR